MEYWQNRAIVKVSKIDFISETSKIKDAFYSICKPLLETPGIEFDKNSSILSIGEVKYSLDIGGDGFGINCSNYSGLERTISYILNENKQYYYYDSSIRNIMPQMKPLESLDFNYIEILNIIMNELIK